MKSIDEYISSSDPLSPEAMKFLIEYREEDTRVDYKERFDPNFEKNWLDLTKDILAFANTDGGYLVFGVRDRTWEKIGLEIGVINILTDSSEIQKKVNRHIMPPITNLRSKVISEGDKKIVFVHVPSAMPIVHMISKDANYVNPSGINKSVLRKGTFYVRYSGGNALAGAGDLARIIDRRIEHAKGSLMSRIARVVEAPADTEVFILSRDTNDRSGKSFLISNAPDSIKVKGMSFTISPETVEQKIAAWSAMAASDLRILPPSSDIWQWYARRKDIAISMEQCLWVAKFSILLEAPAFFWLQNISAEPIKAMLMDAARRRQRGESAVCLLKLAAFFGKGFFSNILNRIGKNSSRLPARLRSYPADGPRSICEQNHVEALKRGKGKITEEQLRLIVLKELDTICGNILKQKDFVPEYMDKVRAQSYDCFLYARDDRYLGPTPNDLGNLFHGEKV